MHKPKSNNTQQGCYQLKQGYVGTKGPKACKENTPHTITSAGPLIQGGIEPCFHVKPTSNPTIWVSQWKLRLVRPATFSQSSIAQFWWACLNCSLTSLFSCCCSSSSLRFCVLHLFTFDLSHQQGVLVNTSAAHRQLSHFGTILCKPPEMAMSGNPSWSAPCEMLAAAHLGPTTMHHYLNSLSSLFWYLLYKFQQNVLTMSVRA